MTMVFDRYYIEADKQIDRIKNYLDSLGEDDLSEMYELAQLVKDFCDRELGLKEINNEES